MVIYVREWNGKKKGVGSQWNAWDNTVATLPDLSQMESQTYINEVDVRKIAVGQKVAITLDADPTKKLAGTVTQIANVGEQRPNQDSKVFEVKVEVTKAGHDAASRHDDGERDRGRVDSERAVGSARGGRQRRRLHLRLQEGRQRRREADDRDRHDERQRDHRQAGLPRTITCCSRRRPTRPTSRRRSFPASSRCDAATTRGDTAKGVTLPLPNAKTCRRRRRRGTPSATPTPKPKG